MININNKCKVPTQEDEAQFKLTFGNKVYNRIDNENDGVCVWLRQLKSKETKHINKHKHTQSYHR